MNLVNFESDLIAITLCNNTVCRGSKKRRQAKQKLGGLNEVTKVPPHLGIHLGLRERCLFFAAISLNVPTVFARHLPSFQ